MGKENLDTEEECVNQCLQLQNCLAVTFIGPNPAQYTTELQGCYKKSGGWNMQSGTDHYTNMVSVNIVCIRNKREFLAQYIFSFQFYIDHGKSSV